MIYKFNTKETTVGAPFMGARYTRRQGQDCMGAKGKSAMRSALDQTTNDRMKFLNLMTLPFIGARYPRRQGRNKKGAKGSVLSALD